MTFEDDTTCCKMHKLGVFPFFVTIGDILRHKLYSVITIGVMLRINLKLVLVLVLRCNLPSQIVTPLEHNSNIFYPKYSIEYNLRIFLAPNKAAPNIAS